MWAEGREREGEREAVKNLFIAGCCFCVVDLHSNSWETSGPYTVQVPDFWSEGRRQTGENEKEIESCIERERQWESGWRLRIGRNSPRISNGCTGPVWTTSWRNLHHSTVGLSQRPLGLLLERLRRTRIEVG